MINAHHKLSALAVVCGLLFVAGLIQLLLLRFQTGDVYPPYSSLRSDPLGTQALFESMDQVSLHRLERNYAVLDRVDMGPDTTMVVSGMAAHGGQISHPRWQRLLDRLDQTGGRLVVTFTPDPGHRNRSRESPEADPSDSAPSDADVPTEGDDAANVDPDSSDMDDPDSPPWKGMDSLGVTLVFASERPTRTVARYRGADAGTLPAQIPWPTPLSFDVKNTAWQIHFAWQDQPVLISRAWGRGTVILMADSYLLSNEALSRQREPGLLAWLLAPDTQIVFDESHHGLVRYPGIATLARKYRLHGVFGCLILLVLLWIWQQAAAFIPRVDVDGTSDAPAAAGLDTQEGLVSLMQRHIAPDQLLPVCFDVWRASTAGRVSEVRKLQVARLVEDSGGQPPGPIYRQICNLLKQGNSA